MYISDIEDSIYDIADKLPSYFKPIWYGRTIFNDRVGIYARTRKGKVEIMRKKMGFFEARRFKKQLI